MIRLPAPVLGQVQNVDITVFAGDSQEHVVTSAETLEGVLAFLVPVVGVAGDVAIDGAEAVLGPVLVATLLLPYLAPPALVRQIRAERASGS